MTHPQSNQVRLDPAFGGGVVILEQYLDNLKALLGSGHATSPLEPDATNFGSFGGTVISPNQSLKAVLQELANKVAGRKEGSDNLSTVGAAATVDFDTANFDNKRITFGNANTTITVATPSRDGRYGLYLRSSAASDRNLSWVFTGAALGNRQSAPSHLNSTEYIKVELEFTQGVWFIDGVTSFENSINAATAPATIILDGGNGTRLDWLVTGAFPSARTFGLPTGLPIGKVMTVTFDTAQGANAPNFNASYKTMGGKPDFTDAVDLTIMRWTDGFHVCGIQHGAW